jgi:hypothetical protein
LSVPYGYETYLMHTQKCIYTVKHDIIKNMGHCLKIVNQHNNLVQFTNNNINCELLKYNIIYNWKSFKYNIMYNWESFKHKVICLYYVICLSFEMFHIKIYLFIKKYC